MQSFHPLTRYFKGFGGGGGGGGGGGRNFSFYLNPVILRKMPEKIFLKDLSEISRGGPGGGWKQREGHNFLRLRKGGGGHEK